MHSFPRAGPSGQEQVHWWDCMVLVVTLHVSSCLAVIQHDVQCCDRTRLVTMSLRAASGQVPSEYIFSLLSGFVLTERDATIKQSRAHNWWISLKHHENNGASCPYVPVRKPVERRSAIFCRSDSIQLLFHQHVLLLNLFYHHDVFILYMQSPLSSIPPPCCWASFHDLLG